jgi:hypothetical protein
MCASFAGKGGGDESDSISLSVLPASLTEAAGERGYGEVDAEAEAERRLASKAAAELGEEESPSGSGGTVAAAIGTPEL